MIKEKRRRKKRWKSVLLTLFILLLLAGIAALVVIKVFTVETVKVEGNKLYEDSQIEEWVLNDEYSWNSLYVYFKYRFLDTQEVPFIDTMEVTLEIPHTIHIEVYEKGLLGYIYMDTLGQNIYFDKDGFVAEVSTDVIDDVTRVNGLSCNQVVLYEKLDLEDKKALTTLLDITQTLKKYELVADAINYVSSSNVSLTYGTIQVNLGKADNLTETVKRLEKIMPSLDGMSGTLHMEEWSEESTDITFEKTE